MSDPEKPRQERVGVDCQGWTVSDRSLIAQDPFPQNEMHQDKEKNHYVNFRLLYEDEFIPKEGGIVTFRYRTGQK
jgi:hypothetical protein